MKSYYKCFPIFLVCSFFVINSLNALVDYLVPPSAIDSIFMQPTEDDKKFAEIIDWTSNLIVWNTIRDVNDYGFNLLEDGNIEGAVYVMFELIDSRYPWAVEHIFKRFLDYLDGYSGSPNDYFVTYCSNHKNIFPQTLKAEINKVSKKHPKEVLLIAKYLVLKFGNAFSLLIGEEIVGNLLDDGLDFELEKILEQLRISYKRLKIDPVNLNVQRAL